MQPFPRPTAPASTAPRPHADVALTDALLRSLPKTDLHLHLDGSLRLPTLLELAAERGVSLPADTVEGLTDKVFKEAYGSLEEYLEGFAYTGAVLQDADALERVSYELAWDNIDEGVCYAEVRFAPHLHMHAGLSFDQVLQAVDRGLARAAAEHAASDAVRVHGVPAFRYGIIVCALRWFNAHMSDYYQRLFSVMGYAREKDVFSAASLELARAAVSVRDRCGLPIVGFDLAGAENGYPANDHRQAYHHAHRNFLKKTVHAGEAYGPESIFQALTDCLANRIGHGTFLFSPDRVSSPMVENREHYVHQLVNYVASQRITIEVNFTSNLQTLPEMSDPATHPVGQMIAHSLSATVCTDNRLVSDTTVTRELELICRHFQPTRRQLRNLVIAGFKGSFFPGDYTAKRAYVRQAINRYEALEARHFGEITPEST